MKNEKLYMVVEDGFAVCLTKDRSGISCWTYRQSDATKMDRDEAERIANQCGAFYGPTVQIVGAHCTLEVSQ